MRPIVRSRRVRAIAATVLAPTLIVACSGDPSSPRAVMADRSSSRTRPNIVYVLADDMRYDDMQFMPATQRLLGGEGASFSAYFVNVSLCCPSRVTGLRGQYAHNTGVQSNGGTNGGFESAYRRGLERTTVATVLERAGYRTGLFGKYLNGYPNGASEAYVPPGWSEWNVATGGVSYFDYTLNENGRLVDYGTEPEDYATDVSFDQAESFIRQAAIDDRPFFAFVSPKAPHKPWLPAPRHAALFDGLVAPRPASYDEADVSDKPRYINTLPPLSPRQQAAIDAAYRSRAQSLRAIDEGVARLYRRLRASGELDNTYFLFSSDNGFHLGHHRMGLGKQTPYEDDIHQPLLVRGPHIAAGTEVSALAGNVDLASTFAAMAGIDAPRFVDGRSLLPLLRGRSAREVWRRAYLIEHWPEACGSRPGATEGGGEETSCSLAADADIPEYQGLRGERHVYVEYATGERELYDLRADPLQLDNRAAAASPELMGALHDRLLALRGCRAQRCRDEEARPWPPSQRS